MTYFFFRPLPTAATFISLAFPLFAAAQASGNPAAPARSVTTAIKAQAVPAAVQKQAVLSAATLKGLQSGLECNPGKSFVAALKASGLPTDGTVVDAPANLKAFGLPVTKISFFPDADYDSNFSSAVFAAGVNFDQVRKAGRMTLEDPKNKNSFSKYTDFGGLYATRDGAPLVKVSCSPPVH